MEVKQLVPKVQVHWLQTQKCGENKNIYKNNITFLTHILKNISKTRQIIGMASTNPN